MMTTRRRLLAAFAGAAGTLLPLAAAGANPQSPTAPTARGPVLFVGSSIFHRWTHLAAQMAPVPVSNRAFDGAQTGDLLRTFDSAVLPSRPRVIVYYCGSNDVDGGDPPAVIFDRIRQFVVRALTALPQTRVIFVSINRAPEKRDLWDAVDRVNHLVEAFAARNPRLQYVDMNPILFNRDGTSRVELFMTDQLHLRPPAYEELARLLRPLIAQAFDAP